MDNNPTTIWIQPETHERMTKAKPKAMTYDELVNIALDESEVETLKKLQTEQ